MRPAVTLLAALLFAVATPVVPAQVLDGEWFKLVVSCNGSGLPPEATEAVPEKVKPLVRYAFFSLPEGSGLQYDVATYAPVEGGGWAADFGGTVTMLDPAETFVESGSIAVSRLPLPPADGAPNIVVITFNGPVKTKFKDEALKSASIKSLGAIAEFTNEAFFFHGRGKLTLTRVPVEKLPFEVLVQATAGSLPEAGQARAQAAPHAAPMPAPMPAPVTSPVPAATEP